MEEASRVCDMFARGELGPTTSSDHSSETNNNKNINNIALQQSFPFTLPSEKAVIPSLISFIIGLVLPIE